MLFAREVMDLMAAFPGRPWEMKHIINHVARGRPSSQRERERYRKGISRVLAALVDHGVVIRKPARPGATPLYIWINGDLDGDKNG